MIIPKWLFPCFTIALNVGSAAVCVFHDDYRRAIYWAAAAILTATVTF
jgi:hypothetical protein